MTAKMGRPTDDPKRNETRIRMTDEDVRILEFCSMELGKTKTDIIRMGIREVYKNIKPKAKF
jgi:predicted DNA-binding protein